MSHAERCPICYGKGKIPDDEIGNSNIPIYKPCHGCFGCGWITVWEQQPGTWPWIILKDEIKDSWPPTETK